MGKNGPTVAIDSIKTPLRKYEVGFPSISSPPACAIDTHLTVATLLSNGPGFLGTHQIGLCRPDVGILKQSWLMQILRNSQWGQLQQSSANPAHLTSLFHRGECCNFAGMKGLQSVPDPALPGTLPCPPRSQPVFVVIGKWNLGEDEWMYQLQHSDAGEKTALATLSQATRYCQFFLFGLASWMQLSQRGTQMKQI